MFIRPPATLTLATIVLAAACSGDKIDPPGEPPPQGKASEQPADPKPGETPASPGDSAATPTADAAADSGPAYLGVKGVGLVVLDGGKTRLAMRVKHNINDIAIAPSGEIWVGAIGGVHRLGKDGRVATIGDHSDPGTVDRLAVAADGTVWAISYKGVSRYDGKSWKTDSRDQLEGATLLKDVTVDGEGRPWVVSSEKVYRKDGDSWEVVQLGGVINKPFFENIDRAPDDSIYAIGSGGLIRHDGKAWSVIDLQARFGAVKQLAVSDAGHIVAGGHKQLRLRHGSDVYQLTPSSVGFKGKSVAAVAADNNGRAWVSTDNGMVIIGADGSLLQQWLPGQVADVAGEVSAIAVVNGGPELPELGAQATGTLKGRIMKSGSGVASARVEICRTPVTMFKKSPCDSATFRREVTTGADGSFTVADLPVGTYGFAIQPPGGKWLVLIGASCCSQMKPNTTFDIGTIPLDR